MDSSSPNWDENRLGWLALAWFPGFGSRTLRKLHTRFDGHGDKAFDVSTNELRTFDVTSAAAGKFTAWRGQIDSSVMARRCDSEGIRFVIQGDDEYPETLANSNDPPLALFVRGATLELNNPVAIVGTRSMTAYGSRVATLLGEELAKAGCEIVSGLAIGIDAKAHEAALNAGGKTIAVIAGGCNDSAIYPRQNFQLAQEILQRGGSIISELPPGTESMKHLFPLRNRIIASLCNATIVVEASDGSGSLITAKLALEENKEVFAVPGPITSEQSTGTNKLLSLGAIPCTSSECVLTHLNELFFTRNVPIKPTSTASSASAGKTALTPEEKELLKILDRPLHIDDLIRASESPSSKVLSQLTSMELLGLVEHQGGNVYARTKRGKEAVED